MGVLFNGGNKMLFSLSASKNQEISAKSRVSLIKGPVLQFSVDEQLIIEDIHNKFEVSWLEHFIKHDRYSLDQYREQKKIEYLDREAAVNWMEYTFCGRPLEERTWQVLGSSMLHNFTGLIMPQFPQLAEMSSTDFHTLCQLSCHGTMFFRSCFAMKLSPEQSNDGVLPYTRSLANQVAQNYLMLFKDYFKMFLTHREIL